MEYVSEAFVKFLEKLDSDIQLVKNAPKKIIWLSGAPGSGKGTNADYIIDYFKLYSKEIVASNLLRTPEMLAKINKGYLLDDVTVTNAVFKAIVNPIYRQGIVVDGFPRRAGQIFSMQWLYEHMLKANYNPKFGVVVFLIDEEESVRRQTARGKRAKINNDKVNKTGNGYLQDVRVTDLDENIARYRYHTFMNTTYIALQDLKNKLPFKVINTTGSFKEVKDKIISALSTLF